MYDNSSAKYQASVGSAVCGTQAIESSKPTIVDGINGRLFSFNSQTESQIADLESFLARAGLVPATPNAKADQTQPLPQGFQTTERALETLQIRLNVISDLIRNVTKIA